MPRAGTEITSEAKGSNPNVIRLRVETAFGLTKTRGFSWFSASETAGLALTE
jgi:hypothetical protein